MASYFQLTKLNASKFPESAFKTIYYSCTWTYCLYLLIVSGKYDYFQKPDSIWKGEDLLFFICVVFLSIYFKFWIFSAFITMLFLFAIDWNPGMPVPMDITALYVVVFAFYLHSVYATLYVDRWRKDSVVMLFHHFLTMSLVGFSYGAR